MLLLVSGATTTLRELDSAHFGDFVVPAAQNRTHTLKLAPQRWAMDNAAFIDFDPDLFHLMLRQFKDTPGCLFVPCPDVVGNANATLKWFPLWRTILRFYGYPVALVAQDGLTVATTPWSQIDALFIGGKATEHGAPEWKESVTARTLVAYAKARGKWVHMGRVNTKRRLQYAYEIGCDSVVRLPKAIRWLNEIQGHL